MRIHFYETLKICMWIDGWRASKMKRKEGNNIKIM